MNSKTSQEKNFFTFSNRSRTKPSKLIFPPGCSFFLLMFPCNGCSRSYHLPPSTHPCADFYNNVEPMMMLCGVAARYCHCQNAATLGQLSQLLARKRTTVFSEMRMEAHSSGRQLSCPDDEMCVVYHSSTRRAKTASHAATEHQLQWCCTHRGVGS